MLPVALRIDPFDEEPIREQREQTELAAKSH